MSTNCIIILIGTVLQPTQFKDIMAQAMKNIQVESVHQPGNSGCNILDFNNVPNNSMHCSTSPNVPSFQFNASNPIGQTQKWTINLTEEYYNSHFKFISSEIPYLLAQQVSIENLIVMNHNASLKETKSRGTEDKLLNNETKVLQTISWPQAMDNKKDILHPIRFDRFPITGAQDLFKTAAEQYDPNNYLPIRSYDLSYLGLTNVISNQGFLEAHNPRSSKLSIKMASRQNFKQSMGGVVSYNVVKDDLDQTAAQSTSQLKNIEQMPAFHHAFFSLYILINRTQPFNKSLDVLWLFLISNNWFEEQTVNCAGYCRLEKVSPASICAQFTDHYLLETSQRFTNKQPHMTINDMDAFFKNFCQSNFQLFKKQGLLTSHPTQNNNPSSFYPSAGSSYIDINTICLPFNMGACKNRVDLKTNMCHDPKTRRALLHICNVRMINGKPCGLTHSRQNH